METIIRQVRDIDAADRRALEHVIGRQPSENQRVIVHVVSLGSQAAEKSKPRGPTAAGDLPDWTNVYATLSEREIDDLDAAIRERADLSRPTGAA